MYNQFKKAAKEIRHMVDNSVILLQRFLDGEEEAFAELVKKYQKRVHTLAWQIIEDYHIAEEITQDVFLKVYEKLPTLKNHTQFDGWLYVIVYRMCLNWIQRSKPIEESIEDIPEDEFEEMMYADYEQKQRGMDTIEHYREIIRKLIKKLPESERTVLTLYYIGEMTTSEISKFLGVSANTIKSRLRRARNRLKAEDKQFIAENFGSVQLSVDLTSSIMKQIADIKHTPPIAKPVLPWAAFGAAAVLVLLLLATGYQYIAHFQKPYSIDAVSEPTIVIVEAPINIDTETNPADRNTTGKVVLNTIGEGISPTVTDGDFAANTQETSLVPSLERWSQVNGPQWSSKLNLFATSDNHIHAVSATGIYRLTEDKTTWMNINHSVPLSSFQAPITEHQGVIYAVNTNDIFNSDDGGVTWDKFCYRPDGDAVGLLIIGTTQDDFTMYLAMQDKGVFRTVDAGRKWIPLNSSLEDKRITAVAAIGNVVFVGTHRGLYRLNISVWDQLQLAPSKAVHSMAVFEENLYVVLGPNSFTLKSRGSSSPDKMSRKIYHSADAGITWDEITPKDETFSQKPPFTDPTKISAVDKTLLVLGRPAFRSKDGGQTWKNIGRYRDLVTSNRSSVLGENERTFYKVGPTGILRTSDSGDTWYPFMNGIVKTKVRDSWTFNDRLYVFTGNGFYESTDDGNTWKEVNIYFNEKSHNPTSNVDKHVSNLTDLKLAIDNNVLYGIIPQVNRLLIFRFHPNDGKFIVAHQILSPELLIRKEDPIYANHSNIGDLIWKSDGFAVSGDTFYMGYILKLFKWEHVRRRVIHTGLIDTGQHPIGEFDERFILAASAEVVYTGKRDGTLYQSIDSGNSWRDVTYNIPYSLTRIKDIKFVEKTVYIATDKGVMTSQDGEHWDLLTDDDGANIIIDRLTIYESSFYGAGDTGVYRLSPIGRWEQILSNIPDKVISLSVSDNKLYIATEKRGIFHTSLEE